MAQSLLLELMRVKRLEDDNTDQPDMDSSDDHDDIELDDDHAEHKSDDQDDDIDLGDSNTGGDEDPQPTEDNSDSDELPLDGNDSEQDRQMDDVAVSASEDPNKQGVIRSVPNAHLVYKREMDDGSYEEMWQYRSDNIRTAMDIKRAILAGTDIPPSAVESEDGNQRCEVWSVGNAQVLKITGLPN